MVRKRICAVLLVVLIAGGISVLGARETYTGKWFGFITDNADRTKGHNITPDEIRKSVAEKGAKYIVTSALMGGLQLAPAEKVAPYAGQYAFVYGSITSDSLTKSANGTPGAPFGGGGAFVVQVTKIEPHENDTPYD